MRISDWSSDVCSSDLTASTRAARTSSKASNTRSCARTTSWPSWAESPSSGNEGNEGNGERHVVVARFQSYSQLPRPVVPHSPYSPFPLSRYQPCPLMKYDSVNKRTPRCFAEIDKASLRERGWK